MFERRLAAILAADVEGYSRHMEQDKQATLQVLSAHRAILDGLIAEHRGRIPNTAGDSVLAEFPSAVDAVTCAVQAQAALHQGGLMKLNAAQPGLRQAWLRCGGVILRLVHKNT